MYLIIVIILQYMVSDRYSREVRRCTYKWRINAHVLMFLQSRTQHTQSFPCRHSKIGSNSPHIVVLPERTKPAWYKYKLPYVPITSSTLPEWFAMEVPQVPSFVAVGNQPSHVTAPPPSGTQESWLHLPSLPVPAAASSPSCESSAISTSSCGRSAMTPAPPESKEWRQWGS